MSDITHPSRDHLATMLFPVVAEWLRSGIHNMADVLDDQRRNPEPGYEPDAVTRHISSVMIDDTGRIAVKTFGGDLFFYRISIEEL